MLTLALVVAVPVVLGGGYLLLTHLEGAWGRWPVEVHPLPRPNPTTIEEYQLLLSIGDGLGEGASMPRVILPPK